MKAVFESFRCGAVKIKLLARVKIDGGFVILCQVTSRNNKYYKYGERVELSASRIFLTHKFINGGHVNHYQGRPDFSALPESPS